MYDRHTIGRKMTSWVVSRLEHRSRRRYEKGGNSDNAHGNTEVEDSEASDSVDPQTSRSAKLMSSSLESVDDSLFESVLTQVLARNQ